MPADRLTHPRIGRSRKVTALTDLEFRVWDTYRWAADDFGVLPKSAAKLRGENDALRDQHTETEISIALQRLIDLELVDEFDHQGATFVCSLTWQQHQKIEHPRQTHLPSPPPQVFERMDLETRRLFRNFHESFQKTAASRARITRETANGKRQTANGSKGEKKGSQRARFERFWTEYPRKVGKDAAWREWLHRSPDDALTNQMIAKVREQRASAQWRDDGGKFIPHPRTWLHQGRWQDEAQVKPVDPKLQSPGDPWWWKTCPHALKCGSSKDCSDLKKQEKAS